MEQAGFETGVKIDVRVMTGCLVIRHGWRNRSRR
ncbi:SymE family type I addiction module toxin [Duffyella gerundensis]|nr:SymE family type I addiction module toxin [Duffyella gerundensis]